MDLGRVKRWLAGDHRDAAAVLEELYPPTEADPHALAPAVRWASAELSRSGISPTEQPLEAIRRVRDADPRLELRPAQFLVHHVGIRAAS